MAVSSPARYSRAQLIGIPPIGLHPVGCFPGNERRRHQIAVDAPAAQMPAEDEAARASFIDDAQFNAFAAEFLEQFIHGIERAADNAR